MTERAKRPAQSPEELLLRPAKRRIFWLLTTMLAFTAIGMSMIGAGQWRMGWLITLFCGLGTVAFAIQLLWPSASYLHLSQNGFVICALFRPSPLIRWDTVSEFRAVSVSPFGKKMVGFDVDASLLPSLAATARGLVGASGALPDTYGRTPDELVDLMNQWRRKALLASGRRLEAVRGHKPAYLPGGFYSIRCGEHFEIFKVLAVFNETMHVRVYPERFTERPESVPLTLGELDGPHDRGIRHLTLSKFASWQPELVARGEVSDEELEGYDLDR